MPLMQSKSKKALSKNIETEMNSGKPQNQAIAIAYDIKRKNSRKKKMAEGGILKKIQDWVEDTGYDSNKEKSNEYVNRDLNPEKAKAFVKGFEGNSQYSKGGEVMKKSFKKMPKMAESSVIKARLLDDEDKYAEGGEVDRLHQGAQEARKYDSQKEEKGVHTPRFPYPHNKESMGESRAGYIAKSDGGVQSNTGKKLSREDMLNDAKKEHSKKLEEMRSMPKPKLKGLAEGGKVSKEDMYAEVISHQDKAMDAEEKRDEGMVRRHDKTIEEDRARHLASNPDKMKHHNEAEMHRANFEKSYKKYKKMAEGGSIEQEMDMQPEEEAEMERHDSIAAAIMAKRRKMAEGGQVDLDENSMEQPNEFYHQNEDVVLKENYDSDMQDMTQPMDSNEMGAQSEEDEENKHDMISTIRSRMNRNRQFKG